MNILVVAPTPFYSHRGTHIRIFDQVKQVAKLGHNVTIATYHIGDDPDFGEVQSKVVIKRIRRLLFWYKKRTAGPNSQKILLDMLLINKIFWLILKNNYDVIHAHLHEGVVISFIVTKLLFWKKIKILGDFHGDLVGEMVDHGYLKNGTLKKLFQFFERLIYKIPHRIITSSRLLADTIANKAPKKVIGCIPDGAENISQGDGSQIRQDMNIPEHSNLVLYTGGFTPDKGLDSLLLALEHPSIRNLEDTYICLAGSPYALIAPKVRHHPLRDKIIILDHFKTYRLDDLFTLATVAIDPKGKDSMQSSGKMVRYIMAGLPIVCFNTEVNRSYLGEGYAYAPLEEFGSLAEKVAQMISDPITLQQSIDWVKSRQKFFTSEALAKALVQEYVWLK